ncbi:MAG: sigma 54-interacting transcriptional regulator [Sandaracinaceae bacterium]
MSDELEATASIARPDRGPRTGHPEPVLRVVWPAAHAGTILLPRGEAKTLGRGGERPLDHASVSRQHLSAKVRGMGVHVADAGSRHGTWLDGKRLDATMVAAGPGSVLRMAEVVAVVETREPPQPEVDAERVPGSAPSVRALRAMLARVALGAAPVLLLGETGTGKEYAARAIAEASGRGPFLTTNCAGLTPAFADSQLFGHHKGAFTGAGDARRGLFREADGGTLFLDEVAEIPLEIQAKLLRAVEQGEVVPLGSDRPERVDVRLVTATHPDLHARVADGRFRRDLYARLSLAEITLPPLSQRRGDIVEWIARMDSRWATEESASKLHWTADAIEALLRASWPENLRGLDRAVYQLRLRGPVVTPRTAADVSAVLAGTVAHMDTTSPAAPPASTAPSAPLPPKPSREELVRVLAETDGSVRATAKHFSRDRRQIYRWMDAYGIDR